MPLHLIKLCVGCDSIQDLEAWIVERRRMPGGSPSEHIHTTRMMPKRCDALLDGGSLYWVIKGQLACRQRFVDVRAFTDADGTGRYLEPDDAPPDLGGEGADVGVLPEAMRRELVALGLL
jgi:hypothetical protein